MIGMDFVSFLILLLISIVVSTVLHYGFKYYARPGFASFMSKIIFGWFGAWLGSPVLGYWFEGIRYENVYIIPALLGSLSLVVILIDLVKSVKGVLPEQSKAGESGS